MKKRHQILLILSILFCFGMWGLFLINKHQYTFWNENNVNVTAKAPLSKEKVKIEFGIGVNSINRVTDQDLFKNRSKYTVIYNGEDQNEIYNEYGENDFLITYDDRYYLAFRHFKLHNKSQHDYLFEFRKQNDSISLEVTIEGTYPMSFKENMIPIHKSKDMR